MIIRCQPFVVSSDLALPLDREMVRTEIFCFGQLESMNFNVILRGHCQKACDKVLEFIETALQGSGITKVYDIY